MTQTFANSLAAVAAVVLAVTSIGTIVTVPPAQASTSTASLFTTELA